MILTTKTNKSDHLELLTNGYIPGEMQNGEHIEVQVNLLDGEIVNYPKVKQHPVNPSWASIINMYVAMFIKNKLVAILKPTINGYVYVWHYKNKIPEYVVCVNPEVNSHVKYMLISQAEAANLTWEI